MPLQHPAAKCHTPPYAVRCAPRPNDRAEAPTMKPRMQDPMQFSCPMVLAASRFTNASAAAASARVRQQPDI
jgi:hypothetical protein